MKKHTIRRLSQYALGAILLAASTVAPQASADVNPEFRHLGGKEKKKHELTVVTAKPLPAAEQTQLTMSCSVSSTSPPCSP